jgi:hypothetical protein
MKKKFSYLTIILLLICVSLFFFNIKNYDKATISLIAASLGAIFAGVSSFGTFLNVQEMRRQREQSISPFFIIKTPTLNFELSNGMRQFQNGL